MDRYLLAAGLVLTIAGTEVVVTDERQTYGATAYHRDAVAPDAGRVHVPEAYRSINCQIGCADPRQFRHRISTGPPLLARLAEPLQDPLDPDAVPSQAAAWPEAFRVERVSDLQVVGAGSAQRSHAIQDTLLTGLGPVGQRAFAPARRDFLSLAGAGRDWRYRVLRAGTEKGLISFAARESGRRRCS